MSEAKTPPPKGLAQRGRSLWRALNEDLEFDDHEIPLLLETCRAVDMIDSLAAVIKSEGVTSKGSTGQTVVHPAVPELRQQQAALSRLITTLNLSNALEGQGSGVALSQAITSKAQTAANARWAKSKRARGA